MTGRSGRPVGDELEGLFGDEPELLRAARLLSSSRLVEPPLDPSFRSALRRNLLQEGWKRQQARPAFWSRIFRGPNLAWAAATVGVLMIAFVAVSMLVTQPGQGDQRILVQPVANDQAIAIDFHQPMDHASAESALHIQPATKVTYEWQGTTLVVHPVSGPLAGNTQYRITVASTAKRADGTPIARTQTAVFVTRPAPTPSPVVTPTPAPVEQLLNERQLAGRSTGTFLAWNGSTIFFLGAGGDLRAVGVDGQNERSLGVTGVTAAVVIGGSQPALIAYSSPAGIGLVPASGGTPTQIDSTPAIALGYQAPAAPAASPAASPAATPGASPTPSASPSNQAAGLEYVQGNNVVAVAPDGSKTHLAQLAQRPVNAYFAGPKVIYRTASGEVHVQPLDGSAETVWQQHVAGALVLGPKGGTVFAGTDGVYVSDLAGSATRIISLHDLGGATAGRLGLAVNQSGELLISTGTALYSARSDGSQLLELKSGEFTNPTWSADGSGLAFQRAGALWSGSVELSNSGPTLHDGYQVLDAFMRQRIAKNAPAATQYLDPNAQQLFQGGSATLTVAGPPTLDRYFVVLAQVTRTPVVELRYTVRLLLADASGVEQQQFDETLTLRRTPAGNLLVHDAKDLPRFNVDHGPQVLTVDVTTTSLGVTFDSDLDPATVTAAFTVTDSSGNAVPTQVSYQSRVVTVTFTGSAQAAGLYHLNVGTGLKDIAGQPLGAGYTLDFMVPPAA